MKKIVQLWSKMLDKVESDVSIKLDEIIYSKKHGHEICIMHLVGKNIFPKMTPEEILSYPKARVGLSKDDLIIITRLDMEIKLRQKRIRIVERDRNGTVILENEFGERNLQSERGLLSNKILLDNMSGSDGSSIGYSVGFKDGIEIARQKRSLKNKLKTLFKF